MNIGVISVIKHTLKTNFYINNKMKPNNITKFIVTINNYPSTYISTKACKVCHQIIQ